MCVFPSSVLHLLTVVTFGTLIAPRTLPTSAVNNECAGMTDRRQGAFELQLENKIHRMLSSPVN